MNTKKKELDQDDLGVLLALIGLLFGAWVRIVPILLAGFPINDGGYFYNILNTIIENQYEFPLTILYNGFEIPFVYPPLGFYISAFLSDIFNIPLITIVQWLPGLYSIFHIPAVYALALQIFSSKYKAGFTAFLYAFTSKTLTWMVAGGGITRGLGQLFLILTLRYVHELYTCGSRKSLLLSILFSSLVVLTHPEAAVHTILACLLLFLFTNRTRQGFRNSLIVLISTLILTSAWWALILINYGLAPILSGAQTGHFSDLWLFPLISFNIINDPFFQLTSALAFLGLFILIAKREYLLPVWLIAMFVLESRNAPNVAVIILNLCGAISLTEMIFPRLIDLESGITKVQISRPTKSRAVMGIVSFMLVNLFVNIYFYGFRLSQNHLPQEIRETYNWVKQNTSSNARFLILSGETNLFCDSTLEWFPTLTGRTNTTTIQGREWIEGPRFSELIDELLEIQNCIHEDVTCLLNAIENYKLDISYVYVAKLTPTLRCSPRGTMPFGGELIQSMEKYPDTFTEVYQSSDSAIFLYRTKLRE